MHEDLRGKNFFFVTNEYFGRPPWGGVACYFGSGSRQGIVVGIRQQLIEQHYQDKLLQTELHTTTRLVTALQLLELAPATLQLAAASVAAYQDTAALAAARRLRNTTGIRRSFYNMTVLAKLVNPFANARLAFSVGLEAFARVFTNRFYRFTRRRGTIPFDLFFRLTNHFVAPKFKDDRHGINGYTAV